MAQNYTQDRNRNRETSPPAMIAWHVAERGDKAFWTRIGAAWDHKDGEGLTLQLDLVPTGSGRIVLRAPKDEQTADQPEGTA